MLAHDEYYYSRVAKNDILHWNEHKLKRNFVVFRVLLTPASHLSNEYWHYIFQELSKTIYSKFIYTFMNRVESKKWKVILINIKASVNLINTVLISPLSLIVKLSQCFI